MTDDDENWRRRARCANVTFAETRAFLYGEIGRVPNDAKLVEARPQTIAKRICADCPVKAPCEVAGRNKPGVWGGLTERERATKLRLARRARARKRAAVA